MLRKFFRRALWITVPPAMGVLFAMAENSGFQQHGGYVALTIGATPAQSAPAIHPATYSPHANSQPVAILDASQIVADYKFYQQHRTKR